MVPQNVVINLFKTMPKTKESPKRKSKQVKGIKRTKYPFDLNEEAFKNLFMDPTTGYLYTASKVAEQNQTYLDLSIGVLRGWNETLDVFDNYIRSTKDYGYKQFIKGVFFGSVVITISWLLGNLLFK